MNDAEFDPDVVVEARDCIVGRVASEVAQRALDGERVAVVNAERAVITGNEESTLDTYRTRAEMGSDQGPAYPRRPDGILKRSIRGMVPYKQTAGREAFERVRVYMGNPFEAEPTVIEGTSLDRLSNTKFTTLGTVAEDLGANPTW
ncbi:MAG: 50S ribosomal protein L13 [Halobaculum sp.]